MSDGDHVANKVLVYATSCTPDFVEMPNGSIACFDLIAFGPDTEGEALSVKARKVCVLNLRSKFSTCYGDESGVKGTVSNTVKGEVVCLPNSRTVKAEKFQIVGDGDPVGMNAAAQGGPPNALGIVRVVSDATAKVAGGVSNADSMLAGPFWRNASNPENLPAVYSKGKAIASKVLKKIPIASHVATGYEASTAVYDGEYAHATSKVTSASVGGGLMAACLAAGLTTGIGGVICAGGAIVGGNEAGEVVEAIPKLAQNPGPVTKILMPGTSTIGKLVPPMP